MKLTASFQKRVQEQVLLGERLRSARLLSPKQGKHEAKNGSYASPVEIDLEPVVFNAVRDTTFQHKSNNVFKDTLTAFTQEWTGIRAASGSFPGHKAAVAKDCQFDPNFADSVNKWISEHGIKRVVTHGFSAGLERFIKVIKVAHPDLPVFGVWHGCLASWSLREEQELAAAFIEMVDAKLYKRIHFLKNGMHVLHPKAHPHFLPNMVPNVESRRLLPPFSHPSKIRTIFANWNNNWKNMGANLVGASALDEVSSVIAFNEFLLPSPLAGKLKVVPYPGRNNIFNLLVSCDLVLNVTIVDCHPMVELEGLAVGTPALSGDLDFDFGTRHAYKKNFQINRNHNPVAIGDAIRRISGIPSSEVSEMTDSYKNLVNKTSIERYAEFFKDGA